MRRKALWGHAEAAAWFAFAVLAFGLTFGFDQTLETYAFGASGWPRTVLILIALAAIGQFVLAGPNRAASALGESDDEAAAEGAPQPVRNWRSGARLFALLALPIGYAVLLDPIGFYVMTPAFIAGVLLLAGERRPWTVLATMTAIYSVAVFVFAKLFFVGLPVGYLGPFYDVSHWLLVQLRS